MEIKIPVLSKLRSKNLHNSESVESNNNDIEMIYTLGYQDLNDKDRWINMESSLEASPIVTQMVVNKD